MLCILKSTSECLSSSPYNQGLHLGLTFSITSQFGYYIFKLPAIRNFYLPPNFTEIKQQLAAFHTGCDKAGINLNSVSVYQK